MTELEGYERDKDGMLVQKKDGSAPQQSPAYQLKTALRTRTAAEMQESASERLDLAIDAVEAILRDKDARHSDKLAAAAFIRDTAHGKPGQSVEVTGKIGIIEIVMAASKLPLIDSSPVSAVIENQPIDNKQ